jgi:hypothetical protein
MRMYTDVEPLDMPEVPRLGACIVVEFGDHVHPAIVSGLEWLEDGHMRLRLELLAAHMVGAWPQDPPPSGSPQLVQAGPGELTREELRAILRARHTDR